ncbi:unnamed protein product [Eruca vesicaria subsp. sativa]|uniref:Uncharacterized protein n=1 Tax=Eruca vesicaria subsp. sativa TaxID=29727 RepID=A0ABC8LX93_ERUVS|nr:unnamed protein product [Eruca vesicaria subsp. sativa]
MHLRRTRYRSCFPLLCARANLTQVETRLLGIDVIVGRQGDSCDAVCKSRGQFMQRYMTCKGSCLENSGADQPAEVADDSPREFIPTFYLLLWHALRS